MLLSFHDCLYLDVSGGDDHLALLICLLALDLAEERLLAALEVRLGENFFVLAVLAFLEVIHVQLTGERAEVTVAEVLCQNDAAEAADVLDDEAASVLRPSDDVVAVLIADELERLAEEKWNGIRQISAVVMRACLAVIIGVIVSAHNTNLRFSFLANK